MAKCKWNNWKIKKMFCVRPGVARESKECQWPLVWWTFHALEKVSESRLYSNRSVGVCVFPLHTHNLAVLRRRRKSEKKTKNKNSRERERGEGVRHSYVIHVRSWILIFRLPHCLSCLLCIKRTWPWTIQSEPRPAPVFHRSIIVSFDFPHFSTLCWFSLTQLLVVFVVFSLTNWHTANHIESHPVSMIKSPYCFSFSSSALRKCKTIVRHSFNIQVKFPHCFLVDCVFSLSPPAD